MGALSGSLFYDVAELMMREGRSQPVVDGRSVAIDDSHRISGYHLINEIVPRSSGFNIQNAYSCSLIVHNAAGVADDLLAEQLAAVINTVHPSLTLTRILLNSEAIWATQYRGTPYNGAHLIQFNYNLVAARREACCEIPGDCLTQKNT